MKVVPYTCSRIIRNMSRKRDKNKLLVYSAISSIFIHKLTSTYYYITNIWFWFRILPKSCWKFIKWYNDLSALSVLRDMETSVIQLNSIENNEFYADHYIVMQLPNYCNTSFLFKCWTSRYFKRYILGATKKKWKA